MYFWKSVGHIRSEIFQVAKFTKFEVKYLESEKNEVNTRKKYKNLDNKSQYRKFASSLIQKIVLCK
jgi:tRNA uridine 5-carbamoylmethylation protein Kti12